MTDLSERVKALAVEAEVKRFDLKAWRKKPFLSQLFIKATCLHKGSHEIGHVELHKSEMDHPDSEHARLFMFAAIVRECPRCGHNSMRTNCVSRDRSAGGFSRAMDEYLGARFGLEG